MNIHIKWIPLFPRLFDDGVFLSGTEDGPGNVPMSCNTFHFGVVGKFLFQFLTVLEGYFLTWSKLNK